MSEIAALAMSETSGQVDKILGITCRTFRYGLAYIDFEHMGIAEPVCRANSGYTEKLQEEYINILIAPSCPLPTRTEYVSN